MRLPAALAAAALLAPAPALAADWVRAESANFVIYTDASAASAKRYAETLEVFDGVLRARHGLSRTEPSRRKLPIYLLRRRDDLKRISPRIGENVAGFYASTLDDTFAAATEDRRDASTLQHEYVHHFMLQHFPYGYPAWLIEGYAEYFMTFDLTAEHFEVGRLHANRIDWLAKVKWLPFDRILKARPSDLRSGNGVAMFYAQSWALTHYLLSDEGRRRQLDAYIKAVGAGADPVVAMTQATGLTPAQLSRALQQYLSRGFPYSRTSVAGLTLPPVTVTALSPAAADVLLAAQRVKADNGIDAPEDRTDGPVLLADLRRLAGKHPGDRLADLALARAEVKLGDLAAAEPLLQRHLAKDAEDVEALQILSLARLEAAEAAAPDRADALRKEARVFAGRAHKLDPDSYPTLIAYIRGREGAPGYPGDNDVRVLTDAIDLAPQVDVLRLKAAQALVARERYPDAANVLRPLALDPHGGRDVEAARTLLTLIESLSANPAAARDAPAETSGAPAG